MSIAVVSRTIQLILAPVVMITSCAILIGGMLTLYSSVNDRLRLMARERMDLLRTPDDALNLAAAMTKPYAAERLHQIDRQMPELLHRHQMIHNALLAVYGALIVFVATMFVIALAALTDSSAIGTVALLVFLLAMIFLLVGVVLIAQSVRTSNDAVQFEARRALDLGK